MCRGSWLVTLLLAPLFLAAGCGGGEGARALRLLEFRQQDFDSVALNEELLFYFSSELDRSSITSDSVRVLDPWGREVAGTRSVRGDALSFLPDLPCASDLSDGGLQPEATYRVVLGGFPRPDGIRSSSGALLSESLVLSFGTARIGELLFLDPFLGPFPLLPAGKRTELEDGVLVLEYGEALDPSYVPHVRFLLTPEASERQPISATARLIENRRDHALLVVEPAREGGAVVERLAPGTYFLVQMQGAALRTLGGREVQPGWPNQKLR